MAKIATRHDNIVPYGGIFYGMNEFTVEFCGDDHVFKTKEEAEAFIDSLV